MTGMDKKYSPLIWLVFYVIALPVSIRGGKFFYQLSNFIAVYLMLLIVVYCCGMLPELNLPKYSTGIVGGGMEFMQHYSSTLWFYVGVEALTLVCDEIKDASRLFGGVRVRPMVSKSKAPNSMDIEKQSTPSEQEKSSVIMDAALPSPSVRFGRGNVVSPTPVECDSPVEAVNTVTRQQEDQVQAFDSEIRNPSSTK
eukprot:gene11006-12255_t